MQRNPYAPLRHQSTSKKESAPSQITLKPPRCCPSPKRKDHPRTMIPIVSKKVRIHWQPGVYIGLFLPSGYPCFVLCRFVGYRRRSVRRSRGSYRTVAAHPFGSLMPRLRHLAAWWLCGRSSHRWSFCREESVSTSFFLPNNISITQIPKHPISNPSIPQKKAKSLHIPDLDLVQASLSVLVYVDVDWEMCIDVSHLVLVALGDTNDQVVDESADRSESGDVLSGTVVQFDVDDLLLWVREVDSEMLKVLHKLAYVHPVRFLPP